MAGVIALVLIATPAVRWAARAQHRAQPKAAWSIGFWFWNGSHVSPNAADAPVDAIYCQAGTITHELTLRENRWYAYGEISKDLPLAREYWLVFRFDRPAVPSLDAVPKVLESITRLRKDAERRNLTLAGFQFDIDSPTRALREYANFLKQVKATLPPGIKISITCLLDWFTNGTDVADLLKNVDEFVPQFYDLQGENRYRDNDAIASPIDAAKWGPIFNRYGKPFRVGISTFGRSRLIPRDDSGGRRGRFWSVIADDVKLLDVAIQPGFEMETSRTAAQELVLTYRATKEAHIGYTRFDPGESIEFVLPTREGIAAAVDQVKKMGGQCIGVVFFRWPAFNEQLAEQPDDVLRAAGVAVKGHATTRLLLSDGACSTVYCVDLFLLNEGTLSPTPTEYTVQSGSNVEYFVPADRMPARMVGPSTLEVRMPPYCCRGRMYLGRVVAEKRTALHLEAR